MMPGMMPMMPMMPGMGQLPQASGGEPMTLEQQNLYNQQLIIMQQQAIQQYHQQLMQMVLLQGNQGGQTPQVNPAMLSMFGMQQPGQTP
jgi:hypothetical protein